MSGTTHEDRQRLIRTLNVGDKVQVRPAKDNKHDPEAVEVRRWRAQLGWIPREAATAVRGLTIKKAYVVNLGTDSLGRWTYLEIEIVYSAGVGSARAVEMVGPVVASILHLMSPKDKAQAEQIAKLPKEEQGLAIDEWNMSHETSPRRPRRSAGK